ncbi:MAG: helix-turn-helix domain-containing protein [Actinobacteria bacterium]|nr:helix-turn-helix domain-containing protein [Actinomycetota bacterium]MCG2802892.1 helix-turn-helix domain-containing protein [Cellulomonas sp.]
MSIDITRAVWEDAHFSQTALLVLLALADHANEDGVCWPSVARLATRVRTSERHVQRVLGDLEQAGWLTRDERPGRSTVFRVTPPTPDTQVTPDMEVTPDTQVREGVTPRSERGDTQVTQNHQRTTTESPEPRNMHPSSSSVTRARGDRPAATRCIEHGLPVRSTGECAGCRADRIAADTPHGLTA